MKKLTEFEASFIKKNILTGKQEKLWDYIEAEDEKKARNDLYFKHGDTIKILTFKPMKPLKQTYS